MVSYTGIAYRKDLVSDVPQSWEAFGQERFAGRMTMLNDMRETIGAALMYLGHSINSVDQAELEKARDVVIGWKRNLAKFENEQYKTGLAAGEFFVVHGYSGDILQVAEDNENIVFFLPKEGFSIARDDMCIPKDARNAGLAHAFINFLHRPDIAAQNMEWVAYLCPNKAAYELVDEELRQNPAVFLPEELLAEAEVMIDLGENIALYTAIWDQIKAAN
jgi:spermidine/putrescine transport system substrate-binding protein